MNILIHDTDKYCIFDSASATDDDAAHFRLTACVFNRELNAAVNAVVRQETSVLTGSMTCRQRRRGVARDHVNINPNYFDCIL